jgi:hypothetical protein
VAGFDGEDRAGRRQVVLAHDVRGSAQVRGDTDAFKNGGRLDEGGNIGDAKVVCAGRHGRSTSRGQGGGEERDVGGLVERGLLDVVVEGLVEPSRLEVRQRVVGETLPVEGVLKMFQRQGVV